MLGHNGPNSNEADAVNLLTEYFSQIIQPSHANYIDENSMGLS